MSARTAAYAARLTDHKKSGDYDRDELARIAVSDQMRRMHHGLVGARHDVDRLEALAQRLSAEADWLEQSPPAERDPVRWKRPDLMEETVDGEEFANSIDRPVSGRGNPWSVPLRVMRRDDTAEVIVNLGRGYEGAPNRAHGGVVAAIYDDLLGFLLMFDRIVAYTAFIKVDYRNATPLHEDITFTAWVAERDGRKLHMRAECRAGEDIITTCEGLFIEAQVSPLDD